MTPTKIEYVARFLIAKLDKLHIRSRRFAPERYLADASQNECLMHARYLLENVLSYVQEDRIGKANRHLAAAQTVLSFARFVSVAESMQLNSQ